MDGVLYAFGSDTQGQLGLNLGETLCHPHRVPIGRAQQVHCGANHTVCINGNMIPKTKDFLLIYLRCWIMDLGTR